MYTRVKLYYMNNKRVDQMKQNHIRGMWGLNYMYRNKWESIPFHYSVLQLEMVSE